MNEDIRHELFPKYLRSLKQLFGQITMDLRTYSQKQSLLL